MNVSGEALSGATVKLMQAKRGVVTDLDGRFFLKNLSPDDTLRVSLLGFEPQRFPVANLREAFVTFVLTEKPMQTDAVVITPGVNPAHRLIRNAMANRQRNDPDNREQYSYTSYNKLKFYPEFDTVVQADAIAFFDSSMFGIWESVTRKTFMQPDRSKEVVMASRVSGLKDRAIPFSPTSFQDLSFYKNWVTLLGQDYVSPIGNNALNKYSYQLYDTLIDGVDTVFSIAFRPKNKRIMGLSGDLKLHSNRWAIHTITADLKLPSDMQFFESTRIEQVHTEVNDSTWFPVQMFTRIEFDEEEAGLEVEDSLQKDLEAIGRLLLEVRSDFRKIQLDTSFTRKDFDNITLDVLPEASERGDDFFQAYRTDSLTAKERNTYGTMDSVVEETGLLQKARFISRLSQGFIRLGPTEIDLYRLYMYNVREKHRFGLGLYTNEKVSRKMRLGGWFGWATGDREWKYGGSLKLYPFKNNFIRLHLNYQNTLYESGYNDLFLNPGQPIYDKPDQQYPPRYFYIRRLEYTEQYQADVIFPSIRNVHHRLRIQRDAINPWYNYAYKGKSEYVLTDFTFDTRIGFGEKYIRTDRGLFLRGTKFPVLTLRYTRGQSGVMGGNFSYDKFEATLYQKISIKGFGSIDYLLAGGEYIGELPLSRMHPFRSNGSSSLFSEPFAMNAMPYNQFYANRFGSASVNFNIENKGWPHPKWNPDPIVRYGFAIGQLKAINESTDHTKDFDIDSPNLGYHEVGVEVGNLIPSIDALSIIKPFNAFRVGAYYRFGPHAAAEPADNLVFKIGFDFILD